MILYGVYVREVMKTADIPSSSTMRCLNHYEEVPLDERALGSLLSATGPQDLAVMISAKSGTPVETRRAVLNAFHESS
jgi:hypothetical protein